MKKEELWRHFIAKNPHWKSENVTLTPAGLKKLFETTYDQAHRQGVENGAAIADRLNRESGGRKKNNKSKVGDIFGGVFDDYL